jgi:hypothetical protein
MRLITSGAYHSALSPFGFLYLLRRLRSHQSIRQRLLEHQRWIVWPHPTVASSYHLRHAGVVRWGFASLSHSYRSFGS